jgi:hypothetical protein
MSMVEYWDLPGGATVTPLIPGSSLTGLASAGLALGASVNNLQGGGGLGGATLCRVILSYQFASAPAANTGFAIWLLRNLDGITGTAFEEGSTGLQPSRAPDLTFSVSTTPDTNVHVISKDVICPAGFMKALLLNNGTGQALGSTAANLSLSVVPITYQGA